MPQLYMIIPVGLDGGRPDNSLPGGQGGYPSQPIYHPGHPDHGLPPFPSQGLPGNQPYPDQGLPGGQGGYPSHPIYHPGHPDHGLPAYPDQGLPPGASGGGGTPVSEDVYTPAPIPEEIASQYVVSAYNPKTMQWTTKSYPPR